ncbi:MAG: hypothetical protein ACWIPH_08860, partial [Ostreibacterium sp.]
MTDSTFLLSFTVHQHQILSDLGLDAWYLSALSRANNDVDYQQKQTDIAAIVGQLNEVIEPELETTISQAPSVEDSLTKCLSSANVEQSVAGVTEKLTTKTQQHHPLARSLSALQQPPIQLNPNVDRQVPAIDTIAFPSVAVNEIEPIEQA